MKTLLENEGVKQALAKFLPAVVASIIVGLLTGGLGIYVMIHLMDARISELEKLPPKIEKLERLESRISPLEEKIAIHEKALDRDFARHEANVADIAHKTDDQEKRLTRLEALVNQTQELLSEIRSDVKILLRGGQ